ncbi:homeobox protein Nkx-6.1-like [Phodopus roborovskii]|uniref:homeobox protein Nkx-6.1-like n=1 Tax=Phodopus roborovskii TaxID=109678 RepID=UPI0021E4E4DD|nr:homeobox protein Nkx-6.1-like [Phodopus roborovskii]
MACAAAAAAAAARVNSHGGGGGGARGRPLPLLSRAAPPPPPREPRCPRSLLSRGAERPAGEGRGGRPAAARPAHPVVPHGPRHRPPWRPRAAARIKKEGSPQSQQMKIHW